MAPRWDCSVPGQLSTPSREVGCPLIFEVLSFKHECIFPYSEPCPFWRSRALQQQRQTWPGLPPDEPRLSRVPASREDLEQFLSRPFLVMSFSNSICSARPPAPTFSRMCAVCVWGGSPFGVQHPHGWKKQHPPSGGPHAPCPPCSEAAASSGLTLPLRTPGGHHDTQGSWRGKCFSANKPILDMARQSFCRG